MKTILLISSLVYYAVATPTVSSRQDSRLLKRVNPVFGNLAGVPNGQRIIIQGTDAFADACSLAKAGRDAAVLDNPIFRKYFPNTDQAVRIVSEMFRKIIGLDTSPGTQAVFPNLPPNTSLQAVHACAAILTDITVVPDFVGGSKKRLACDGTTGAELRHGDGEDTGPDGKQLNPELIICDPGLERGGIYKGYHGQFGDPAPEALTCDVLDDRVSWRMESLGSFILHEYTHWYQIALPQLGIPTTDTPNGEDVYGPVKTRKLAADPLTAHFTIQTADSYVWFATEVFWTNLCHRHFGDPHDHDDEDPNSENAACGDRGHT